MLLPQPAIAAARTSKLTVRQMVITPPSHQGSALRGVGQSLIRIPDRACLDPDRCLGSRAARSKRGGWKHDGQLPPVALSVAPASDRAWRHASLSLLLIVPGLSGGPEATMPNMFNEEHAARGRGTHVAVGLSCSRRTRTIVNCRIDFAGTFFFGEASHGP